MSSAPHAPRLRDQLLLLLIGAAWLCLLSVGVLTGGWLHQLLLKQAPFTLEAVAVRTEAGLNQMLARQRDRVALLAARSDLRQALQALQQQDSSAVRHRLGEVLGDAIGTVPSFRHALIIGPDQQVLAASDPALIGQPFAGATANPGQVTISSEYLPLGDGGFRHRVNLIWAGQTLGTLQVEESAADLHGLFDHPVNQGAPFALRLFREHDGASALLTSALIAGRPVSVEPEIQLDRKLSQQGWRLQVALPRQHVLQPFYQWLGGLLVLAVLLTLIMLVLGGNAARRFSRPLDLLAQYASHWRVGTPWRARMPARSSAELQQLADSLAQMAKRENAGQKALTEALLETQQVEEQFRHLFENSPVACLLADQCGLIQLINPACASLFGYRVDELRGQSVELLMPAAARAEHSARMAGFFNAPRERLLGVSRDLFGLRRDGVELQIEIGVTPIRLGGESLALATINDLSTRKAYEQALLAMSRTDGLTGVPNRRHFDQVFADEWRRLKRSRQGAAVLMIDIDHFKMLNDRHGHLVGDETLRMVAKALKQQIHRPGDFLARYGGEEFVVLLPDTDRDGAQLLAEQMRQAVEALPAVNQDQSGNNDASQLSVSIGVASCKDCSEQEPADLLGNADRLLYGAKRAGRNRVMA